MTTAAFEQFSDSEREALGPLEFAVCVATFYEELAERLLNGAAEGFDLGGVSEASVHTYRVPGAYELPSRRQALRRVGTVRRNRLPRRGDPRRDQPLRPRLRVDRLRHPAGPARHRRPLRLRRDHRRRHGPGPRPARAAASATRPRGAAVGRDADGPLLKALWPDAARYHHAPDGQGLSQLRQRPPSATPEPLDGGHAAALQPEPCEGADPGRQHLAPGIRLRALPTTPTRSRRPSRPGIIRPRAGRVRTAWPTPSMTIPASG